MYVLTAGASKGGDLSNAYINERGRIVFVGFSSRYYLCHYVVDLTQNGADSVVIPHMRIYRHWTVPDTPLSDSIRDCNSLMCRSTSLEKNHLIEIYDSLYCLIGANLWEYTLIYNPVESQCPYGPGSVSMRTELLASPLDSLVIGKIPVQLTEQAMAWEVHANRNSTPFAMCRYNLGRVYLRVLSADFARSVDHLLFITCRSFKKILL